jgi:hypothetical protein
MKPFDDYPDSGRKLFGRPSTGGNCRTGYGLALQQMTGISVCAYCGVDLTGDYYRWLLMNVDHVVPAAEARLLGILVSFFEDAINKVLACSGCNGFPNRYKLEVKRLTNWSKDQFIVLRDRVFEDRQAAIASRRQTEMDAFAARPWALPVPSTTPKSQVTEFKPTLKGDAVLGVAEFVDKDAEYLNWIESHPEGFVVNTTRFPTANYLKLHRASCRTISGEPSRGIQWTIDYRKACSSDVGPLENWARRKTGGELQPCGLCKPIRDRL